MTTDLEVYEPAAPPATLIPAASPDEFLKQAGNIAKALVDVVKERGLSKQIGGKEHIQVEAWTTLGSLLGSIPGGKSVFAVADGEPEFVEIDGIKGFRAHVKAVTIDGETVGAAWAYCMRDEPSWRGKPLHALAAMAETRATSRALRKPLGFIVELAGYSATAPEEMPAEIISDPAGRPFPDQADPTSQYRPPESVPTTDPNLATGPQLKNIGRLMGVLEKQDGTGQTTRESLKAEIMLAYGVTTSKELTKAEASEVINGFKLRAGED